MRRVALSLVLAIGLAASSSVGSATAISASILPGYQTHPHNVAAHWTGSWSGRSPFYTEFYYGDNLMTWVQGPATSHAYTHGYSPCPGDPTLYYQELDVFDNWPGPGNLTIATSSARESQGSPC
jgi:hypothetical protein